MTPENEKALVVGYFLSKFDMKSYEALGYSSRSTAHAELAAIIGAKPTTLKNMRDQFDPLHGHRDGWHQRELSSSRVEVVEKYKAFDFESLLVEVLALLKKGRRDMKEVFQQVCDFCANYPEGIPGGLKASDPRALAVKESLKVLSDRIQAYCDTRFPDQYTVQHTKGIGAFPRIPYVVILPHGQKTSDGIYVSMCFDKNGKGAVFGCAQSVTNPRPDFKTVIRRDRSITPEIDVDGSKPETKFNNSFANPLDILRDEFDEQAVLAHLGRSISLCDQYLSGAAIDGDETVMPFSIEAFKAGVQSSGLVLADEAYPSVIAALHAKPFLLFTGLSGSGKTQLAQAFSKWICADKSQIELIAVGADWTSNENLLGYPDALHREKGKEQYCKPDNGALDLILRAQNNPTLPYFLILDEMNLSHVERYFADFLSAMESGEAISLHADTGADWDGVPGKLKIPKNLFVIGTVNVDETTYMFSPKVLDRANVIEFRVSDKEMQSFLAKPVKPNLDALAGQGAQYAKAFVTAADPEKTKVELDETTRARVSAVLMQFFPELKEAGAEFGYRTAHEICRFVYFYKQLTEPAAPVSVNGELGLALDGGGFKFEAAMDAAIMQKLLPKLHGARRKLEPILEKLEKLCEQDYPVSLEKIQRMLKRIREHGFTSFAEA